MTSQSVRDALKAAVTAAMKQRDRAALSVYRTALAAIDNAEAVPVESAAKAGAIEESPVGVGRQEAARRALTDDDMAAIVRGEAQERLDSAEALSTRNPEAATRLRHEAALLTALLST